MQLAKNDSENDLIQKMERQSVGVVETHRKNTPTRPVLKPNKSTS